MRELFPHISTVISETTRQPFKVHKASPVGGGSINETFRLESADGRRYFLKLNDAHHLPLFAAEAEGLEAISTTSTLRVPRVIARGTEKRHCYLVLEHLELGQHGDAKLLGERLAALHRCPAEYFGFSHDNFIGSTIQPNAWKEDWIDFWRGQRLGFQLRLVAENRLGISLQSTGERLLDSLPAFFGSYSPQPSLLHGDLWSGNHAHLADGTPVVFDPAAYYGDRECDIAMTELFGGYPPAFYAAYRTAWPLDPGYAVRRDLYNLYHILNHANLFGGGYLMQAEQLIHKLLAEVK